QPRAQRREVLEDCPGVPLPLAAQRFHRVLPGLARPDREHRAELLSRRRALVDRALVEWPGEARRLAERAVELKLIDEREKVAGIRGRARDVVLRVGVEV